MLPGAGGEVELPEHPRGTLAILLIYALLWVVGWGLLFGVLFLGRGAPTVG
jgi:hypothetical protein